MSDTLNFYLPFGDSLRSILVRPDVTEAMLKQILKSRGIFLHSYRKEDMIPVLMRTFLSTNEVDELLENLQEKEAKQKRRTTIIPWTGSKDLLSQLPVSLDIKSIINDKFKYKTNFRLLNSTNFIPVEGRKDKVEMTFTLQETNHKNAVESRKSNFDATITLEIIDNGSLSLSTTKHFTSSNTKTIIDGAASVVKKELKAKGAVDQEDDFERVLFEHFTNRNRGYFMMRFYDSIKLITPKRISSTHLTPDSNFKLPVDVEKFLSEIEDLQLSGKSLHSNALLTEDLYKDSIIISSLSMIYEFDHVEGKGTCEILYHFPEFSLSNTKNVEFEFRVNRVTFYRNYRDFGNKNKVRSAIYDCIQEHMLYNFNNLKE